MPGLTVLPQTGGARGGDSDAEPSDKVTSATNEKRMTRSSDDARNKNMIRHFTATGFVVHNNATLLHWHRKVQEWLPPGGHVDPNEDPVQTTLREIKEETGFDVEIVPTQPSIVIGNLDQVHAPHSIMIEDVVDKKHGEHQHIDHIYFTQLTGDETTATDEHPDASVGWLWATLTDLQNTTAFQTPTGENRPPPEDVLKLGTAAIQHVSSTGSVRTQRSLGN